MGRMMSYSRGGRQENKRWSLIHGPRFLAILLVISMIHVAASQNKMSTLDQGLNKIRSPRYVKTAGKTNTQSSRVCNTTECIRAAKRIKSSMNLTVDPCDDFYGYACGKWLLNNRLPSYFSHVKSYSDYNLATYKRFEQIKRILGNEFEVRGASKEVQEMPLNLYKSCMNLTTLDNLGGAPLRERIRELGGWSMTGDFDEDTWEFNKTLISIHKMVNKGPLFTISLVQNRHNRTKKVIQIDRAGPSIPMEEYQKPRSKKLSELRHLIIFTVTVVLGADTNTTIAKVDEMLRFEGQLANVSLLDDLFQPGPVFNTTLLYFQHMVPQFDWIGYFNELFAPLWIPKSEILYPKTLVYLRRAFRIIQNTPKSVLANYMVWYVLRSEVEWLSVKYYEAMKGIKVPRQLRFHSCVHSSETSFGDLLMVAYINDNHTQLVRSKNMAKIMANEEIQAFKENVKELTWLDNATKSEAIKKIDAMAIYVAFPDYMLNSTKLAISFEKYRGLNITAETYYKNKVSITKRLRQQEIKDFRKPIDNALWKSPPPQASTWYFLESNSLYISEEYIRPPLFYPNEFLRAYSFGIFGSTAGHWATKALGTIGGYFDKDGKRRNWWSEQSLQEFHERLRCYVKQYSAYKILGKWPINGGKAVDDSIADNDGLKLTIKAYYNWAKQNPNDMWLLPGLNFTNEQLVYIGFAQRHCGYTTPQELYRRKDSGHGDRKFRVIGSLANSIEFANAFNCKINSTMNPIKKCHLYSKDGPLD